MFKFLKGFVYGSVITILVASVEVIDKQRKTINLLEQELDDVKTGKVWYKPATRSEISYRRTTCPRRNNPDKDQKPRNPVGFY